MAIGLLWFSLKSWVVTPRSVKVGCASGP